MEEESLVKKEDNLNQNDIQNNNEQVNMTEDPKKGNGFIIGILIIIIVSMTGYFVYDKFIKKEEPPKENNTEEKGNNEQDNTPTPSPTPTSKPSNNDSLAGKTFKSKDGKKVLKIVSKDDSEALKKAKELEVDLELYSDDDCYFAYYNGVFYIVFEDDPKDINNNSKYMLLNGVENGHMAMCLATEQFIINKFNNELILSGAHYLIHHVGEKYYFSGCDCAEAYIPLVVYDENINDIGVYYLGDDSKENVYVLDKNGTIIKYNPDGTIVKKSNNNYENIHKESITYGDTLYIVVEINKQIYLVDAMSGEKYALNGVDEFFVTPGYDYKPMFLKEENGVIKIFIEDYDENDTKYDKVLYFFNPSTKELTKNK